MSAFDRLPARLLALALTLCISLGLARHFTGARVAQMEARTVDSLTAALLEAGAQKALAGAERAALAQLAAAGKTVPTADLSPEDPAAPLPGATRLECPGGIPWDSIGEQTLNRTEEALVQVLVRSPLVAGDADRDRIADLALELKRHYFLDGYYYCRAETDPERLARKRAVWQLESAVIDSLYRLLALADGLDLSAGSLAQPMTLLRQLDGEQLLAQALQARTDFAARPDAGQFPELEAAVGDYLARYAQTCRDLRDLLAAARDSSNDALGLTGLLGRLEQLYLGALDTLDAGLRVKDLTNPVYAEGVDGLELWSRPLVYRQVASAGLTLPVLTTE